MTIPVVRQRTKRPKTRTGCRTCKSRHLKCDEERPFCRKCVLSGRECGGYELQPCTTNTSRRLLLPVASELIDECSLPQQLSGRTRTLSPQEWYAVEFFHGQSSFPMPGCSMVNSWELLALQFSHTEVAIQSAIIALGALHRARGPDPPLVSKPKLDPDQHKFALQHYAKAVSAVQQNLSQNRGRPNFEVVLLASLLFMSFELLQGGYNVAVMHRATGLEILAERYRSAAESSDERPRIVLTMNPTNAMQILAEAFVCTDCDLTTSGVVGPKLEAVLADGHGTTGELFDTLDKARLRLNVLSNAVSRLRSDLEASARVEMEDNGVHVRDDNFLSCWTQTRGLMLDVADYPKLSERVQKIRETVATWSSCFSAMPLARTEAEHAERMGLQVQFMNLLIVSSSWDGASEATYDQLYPDFCETIEIVEQLLAIRPDPERPEESSNSRLWYSARRGSGMIVTLYLVAAKCRDGLVRKKAVSLLRRLRIQEGTVSTNLMARLLEHLIYLEEGRARQLTGICEDVPLRCEDVPEEARFIDVTVDIDWSSSMMEFTSTTRSACWPGFVVQPSQWFTVCDPTVEERKGAITLLSDPENRAIAHF